MVRSIIPHAAGHPVAVYLPRTKLQRVKSRFLLVAGIVLLVGCAKDRIHTVRISVADQKMVVMRKGVPIATYDVSTSKFGLGDRRGSCATPLGRLEIVEKIGSGAPIGMKFKDRRPTGEIVPANAPGRDPIVSRILWLKGLEARNRHAHARTIYIHGTAEEWKIGRPASYGCIRMRSHDVIDLFNTVGIGAQVEIMREPLLVPTQKYVMTPAQRQSISHHAIP